MTQSSVPHSNGVEAVRHADRGEVLNKQTLQEREGTFRGVAVGWALAC